MRATLLTGVVVAVGLRSVSAAALGVSGQAALAPADCARAVVFQEYEYVWTISCSEYFVRAGAALSTADKTALLKWHNTVRCAKGLKLLTWSTAAQQSAETYAKNCQYKHSTSSQRPGMGENVRHFLDRTTQRQTALKLHWESTEAFLL